MSPWLWIAAGGVFEACWAVTLNLSDGFSDPFWAVVTIGITLVSMWFLNKGLREGVPVGAGYAVWTGCGAMCSVVAGILLFGETLSPAGWFFLALLIAGVVLMQTAEGQADQ